MRSGATRASCAIAVGAAASLGVAMAGGPPANDDCADAIDVALEAPVAFDTTDATTDGGPATGCFYNNDLIAKDVWFRFVAPLAEGPVEYRVSLCGSAYDSRLAVYDGCSCGGLGSPIACDDDFCDPGLQSETDFLAAPGECYLIRVGGYVSSGGVEYAGAGTLTITVAPPPPDNDLCAAAVEIPVPGTIVGVTTDATKDDEFTGCGTGFITDIGVWYRVIGTGTSMTATTCAFSDFDTKLTVFCGGCEGGFCVNGNNDYNCTPPPPIEHQSRVVWCSREGEEYLILVHGTLGEFGSFQLDVTANAFACSWPAPCELPANDDCANAQPVGDGETLFDTRLATTDGPPHELCSLAHPDMVNDLWFAYTAPVTGLATFSLCGGGFDDMLAVYAGGAGACGDLAGALLNCDDDFDCDGDGPDIDDIHAQITIPVACGLEYLLRVGGYNGDTGGGRLTITSTGVPCPVDCTGDCANGDGVVDFIDLLTLLSQWGSGTSGCDLDEDGTVGFADLLTLLSVWGPCESP